MVSNRFESKMSWRPVAKPAVKPIVLSAKKAPPTLPKPRGNVLVYVYETPGVPPVEYEMPVTTANDSFQPNSQPVFNEYSRQENGENILERSDVKSRMRKLRDRAEEAGEGYKLIADMDPLRLKNSSRGGQMFLKQRKRMQDYTSPESIGKIKDEEDDSQLLDDEEFGERPTPWNLSKTSSSSIKYTPKSIFQSSFSKKRKRKDQVLPPLRSPPPEWRAKVESAYRVPRADSKNPIRSWNSVDESRKPSSRSGSAPPLTSDELMSKDREKPRSVIGMRDEHSASQRNEGVSVGRGVLTSAPYIQYDFNARPVGWSRTYATQY